MEEEEEERKQQEKEEEEENRFDSIGSDSDSEYKEVEEEKDVRIYTEHEVQMYVDYKNVRKEGRKEAAELRRVVFKDFMNIISTLEYCLDPKEHD
jgi:hypothetical protein